MAIREKLEVDELYLDEIIRHPILCGEFWQTLDIPEHKDEEFYYSVYQKEYLCDFNNHVSLCCGRAVGKCNHKDSRILNTDTGEYKTVEEWYKESTVNIPTIDYNSFKQKTGLAHIEYNGVKPLLEIQAQLGYSTKVTEEHPFLTNNGWVDASKLKVGDYIATPRELNYFGDREVNDLDLIYIAHFIAEGIIHKGAISTTEPEVIKELELFANKNNMGIRYENNSYYFSGSYRLRLLEKYNLRNKYSYEKFIPKELFSLSRRQISMLLNRLFGDDGWCYNNSNSSEIGYATTSEQLARDIKHLLLRFGIVSSLSFKTNDFKGVWTISIKGAENYRKFSEIGFIVKRKQDALDSLIDLPATSHSTNDIIPIPNYKEYKQESRQPRRNVTKRPLKYYPTRSSIDKILNVDDELYKWFNSDIRWVKITSISELEPDDTYSIEVDTYNTMVCDDIYSHNTVSLVGYIVWLLINGVFPNEYVLYTVPSKVHLEPVFNGLTRAFRTNLLLKHYIEARRGINNGTFTIKLLNHAQLMCRIAGQSGTGANVIGLHTPVIILDEAGYYPQPTWNELQPVLNRFQPGYKLFVSGVPTGLREGNVLFFVDEVSNEYSHHRTSALMNPRYSEKDHINDMEKYGGKDNEDYIHFVLGRHGMPVFAVFDRRNMDIKEYPTYKIKLDGLKLTEGEILTKLATLPNIIPNDFTFMGVDLGYTEPTSIIILYEKHGIIKEHCRIEMTKVEYPIQERIIDYLDTKFNVDKLGIDAGSSGKSTVQHLILDDKYLHKNYKNKLYPVEFGSWFVLGQDADGEDIKTRMKPFTVSLLQEYTNSHRISYPSTDMELIIELERMTYTKNTMGDVIYKTLTTRGSTRGADHNTAALLSGIIVYYITRDSRTFSQPQVKLHKSSFTFVDV